jgi:hypothetical protein
METEEEIQHVREAYTITDPLLERTTKAHITDNSRPLQIILLERDPGGTTLPHYHVPTEALPELPTRRQILVCQSGKARVGIFTRQGQALAEVVMRPSDLVLLLEGHEVEFLERGTRLGLSQARSISGNRRGRQSRFEGVQRSIETDHCVDTRVGLVERIGLVKLDAVSKIQSHRP